MVALAKSGLPGTDVIAGELYQFATRLNQERAGDLDRVRPAQADIRFWELNGYAIYFRIDGPDDFTVLHVGEVTGALRVTSERVAKGRA